MRNFRGNHFNKSKSDELLALRFSLPLTTFFILFTILFFPTIKADVVSVNVGGSQEIAVTSDKYIEGFFSGIPVAAAVCGNSVIESGEQCDDGGTVSGDGCSSTCQTEAVTPPGPGGGTTTIRISAIPSEFNLDLVVNTKIDKIIQIRNLGATTAVVSISQQNLQGRVSFERNTIVIPTGQVANLNVTFIALNETGFFTGIINIGGQQVLVALNVKTQFLLFDSNIIVLNENYLVSQGDELRTRVILIPLGDPERMDVNLLFIVKDYSGKIYLTKSETLLVENVTGINRDFDTGKLPLGDYIIGLELKYPNGVAPSSAHFEVVKGISMVGKIILYLISLILVILILILIVLIWRRREKKEEEKPLEESS